MICIFLFYQNTPKAPPPNRQSIRRRLSYDESQMIRRAAAVKEADNSTKTNSNESKYGTFKDQNDSSRIDNTSINSVSSLKNMWDSQSKKKSRRKGTTQNVAADENLEAKSPKKPRFLHRKLKGEKSAEIHGFSKRNSIKPQKKKLSSDRPVSVHNILSGDSHDSLSDSHYDNEDNGSSSPPESNVQANGSVKQSKVKKLIKVKTESFMMDKELAPVNCCPIL